MPNCSVISCEIKRSGNGSNITLHRLPKKDDKKKKWLDIIGRDNLNMLIKNIYICSNHFDESSFNRTMNITTLRDDALPSRNLLPSFQSPARPSSSGSLTKKNQDQPLPATDMPSFQPPARPSRSPSLTEINQDKASSATDVPPAKPSTSGVLANKRQGTYTAMSKMRCNVPLCKNIQNHRTPGITFHAFPKDPDKRKQWLEALSVKELSSTFWEEEHKHKICSEHFRDEDFYETKQGLMLHSDAVPIRQPSLDATAVLTVCRVCLAVNPKVMYDLRDFRQAFEEILGVPVINYGRCRLPQRLCFECAARLNSAKKFRDKAMRSDTLLRTILQPMPIDALLKISDIKKLNREQYDLKSPLVQQLYDKDHFDVKIKDTFIRTMMNYESDLDENSETDEQPELLQKEEIIEVKCEETTNVDEENDEKINVSQLNEKNKNIEDNIQQKESNKNTENKSNCIKVQNYVMEQPVLKIHEVFVKEEKNKTEHLDLDPSDDEHKKSDDDFVDNTDFNNDIEMEDDDDDDDENKKEMEDVKNATEKNVRRNKVATKTDPNKSKQDKVQKETPIDKTLFKVTVLTYERQKQEIEEKKESNNYINAPYKCTLCYIGFLSESKYERHMFTHSEECGKFQCTICKIRKSTRGKLNRHIFMKHSREYKCQKCKFVTRGRPQAVDHMQYHTGKTFECSQCSSVFNKKTSFLNHRRVFHTSDIVCELCGYTFVTKSGLLQHKYKMHRHEKDVEIKGPYCKECDVTFLSEEIYKRHLRLSSKHLTSETDPIRIKNTPSRITNKLKAQGKRQRAPRKARKPESPIICEQCGTQLATYKLYALHFSIRHREHTRTQQRPGYMYICDQCGKVFSNQYLLKYHAVVHTGLKFECEQCGKSFIAKSNLKKHILTHDPNYVPEKYKCTVCDKEFTEQTNLNKHRFLHTGEKPFSCDICNKTFSTSERLHSHVKHVHLKVPWPKKRKRETIQNVEVSNNED